MHELGVVFHIIKKVDKIASENKVEHVNSVTLEIGEVSMIVPSYFEDCWKWAVDNRSEKMKGCKLIINIIKGVTKCENCNTEYSTVEHGKICPHCGSDKTFLIRGNEVMIKEIEVF